ncbi:hypothetical protein LCGC14_1814730 [marine sediment metagenome]|uniref:Uncharacterized protein n=1 Tax=marine sediment metagenome TaxID=412755 RepID=A0A0F9JKB6_9ZZZZ
MKFCFSHNGRVFSVKGTDQAIGALDERIALSLITPGVPRFVDFVNKDLGRFSDRLAKQENALINQAQDIDKLRLEVQYQERRICDLEQS